MNPIKEAIEALEGVIRVADRATVEFDNARAALASLRSMQGEAVPECARWNFDDVHGQEASGIVICKDLHDKGDRCKYKSLAPSEVLAIINDLRSRLLNQAYRATPPTEAVRMSEAGKEEWAVLPLSAEILHLDDEMLRSVLIEIRANVRAARRLMTNGSTARMTVAQIEALFQQAADADEEVHIRFARAVEQATAQRLGVTLGDV